VLARPEQDRKRCLIRPTFIYPVIVRFLAIINSSGYVEFIYRKREENGKHLKALYG
jgi:hypothetical protein